MWTCQPQKTALGGEFHCTSLVHRAFGSHPNKPCTPRGRRKTIYATPFCISKPTSKLPGAEPRRLAAFETRTRNRAHFEGYCLRVRMGVWCLRGRADGEPGGRACT